LKDPSYIKAPPTTELMEGVVEGNEASSFSSVTTLSGHSGGMVLSLDLSIDGAVLVTGGKDKMIQLWDISTNTLLGSVQAGKYAVTSLKISKDMKYLITGNGDTFVRLWRFSDGSYLKKYKGHETAVLCCDISPTNNVIASGSDDCTLVSS